jgi:F420-dependent oxidoreductase-like protein
VGLGLNAGSSLGRAVERAAEAERLGFDTVWSTQPPAGRDSALVLSAYAAATSTINLGTSVLPLYLRHPVSMAQTALTLDELSGGRFRLGIGVSHKAYVETMWGLQLRRPLDTMRNYVEIVRSLVTTGEADVQGPYFTARASYTAPRRQLPIYISALGPGMLELAGEIADGVTLWMCAPDYIGTEVVSRVLSGRARAGKTLDGFEIIASVPVCLTADRAAGLEDFRVTVASYGSLPSYRRVLERAFPDFTDQPNDHILNELGGIGDEADVVKAIERYADAGATQVIVGRWGNHPGAATVEETMVALSRHLPNRSRRSEPA